MMHAFPELTLDGVLVAPFVTYAVVALLLYLPLRPLLRALAFDRFFSNPPIAELSVYLAILATLIVIV